MPTCYFTGKGNVLPALTYGNGEIFIIYNNFHGLIVFINNYPCYFSRRESIANISGYIRAPLNNINFFTAKFLHNTLHPVTLHAYTGANRVNIRITRGDSYFSSYARHSCSSTQSYNPFCNFRDFGFEQFNQKFRMCSR